MLVSRLDSFIRRLTAQRACLDNAASLIANVPGPILELGLGNGRTFDHLRETLPERAIYAFDRQVAAHPDCIPDADHMILGDFLETLPTALDRIGSPAAMAHCDTGTGDKSASQAMAARLAPLVDVLMAPGAVVVSDQPMQMPGWQPQPLPPDVAAGRYYIWRVGERQD